VSGEWEGREGDDVMMVEPEGEGGSPAGRVRAHERGYPEESPGRWEVKEEEDDSFREEEIRRGEDRDPRMRVGRTES
jgi:hypothetical protein